MQNAYSRQASIEIERQLGGNSTISVGYQYLRGREPDHLNQSERAGVRRRGHEQRLPPGSGLREQQPVLVGGDSSYHGVHVSFVQRPTRVGPLPRQLHAVEGDEQRRREFFQLAD